MSKYYALVVIMFSVFVLTANNVSSQNTQLEDIQKQAARDARADVNEIGWLGAGVILPVGSYCAGCSLAILTGNFSTGGTGSGYIESTNLGCTLGAAVAINALGLLSIYSFNSTVNPNNLIGKSPEEVEKYSETYKKSVKDYRVLLSGLVSGGILAFITILEANNQN